MTKTKPLQDVRILVTRAKEQSAAFQKRLEDLGALVVLRPMIEIRDVTAASDVENLRRAMSRLPQYRWILFTSSNAVGHFIKRLKQWSIAWPAPGTVNIGAIGEETARTLEAIGLGVDVCPEDFKGEGFLTAMLEADGAGLENGAKILIPRAREGREVLADGLRQAGATVDALPIYETVASDVTGEDLWKALPLLDAVTFTSSSTVRFFFEKLQACANFPAVKQVLDGRVLATIGPVTAGTLQERGFKAQITAEPFTTDALANALAEYFGNRRHVGTK